MSRMSELMLDIEDRIEEGVLSFEEIAKELNIPLDWVNAAAEQLQEQYAEMDGQPDEAQEWYDFDPDC